MTRQLLLDLLPATPPTLDNFVAGANGAAMDALENLLPGRAIYLWGAPGTGRTHLLKALGAEPDSLYFKAADAADTLKSVAMAETITFKLIALDDVGLFNKAAQAALFALYNRWREMATTGQAFAMLLAGDRAPLAMSLREDLRTRLGWDLVFRLEPLSDPDRIAALNKRAHERGLALSPDIIKWLLGHYARDMGRLGALLDALDRYSLETHRAITLPLLRDLLALDATTESNHL